MINNFTLHFSLYLECSIILASIHIYNITNIYYSKIKWTFQSHNSIRTFRICMRSSKNYVMKLPFIDSRMRFLVSMPVHVSFRTTRERSKDAYIITAHKYDDHMINMKKHFKLQQSKYYDNFHTLTLTNKSISFEIRKKNNL